VTRGNSKPDRHVIPPLPPALPGFEHVNRYYDPVHREFAAKILPGELYVTSSAEMIVTVLGSCVSVCLRDTVAQVGGMNHFMLPEGAGDGGRWDERDQRPSARYGLHAMEQLIEAMQRFGARRDRLEAKLFGGGRVLERMADVGATNIAFARDWLQRQGLRVLAEDVGDVYARKLYYYPASGIARVMKLRNLPNSTLFEREEAYRRRLADQVRGKR
jgi:chemotaxis protein CheD